MSVHEASLVYTERSRTTRARHKNLSQTPKERKKNLNKQRKNPKLPIKGKTPIRVGRYCKSSELGQPAVSAPGEEMGKSKGFRKKLVWYISVIPALQKEWQEDQREASSRPAQSTKRCSRLVINIPRHGLKTSASQIIKDCDVNGWMDSLSPQSFLAPNRDSASQLPGEVDLGCILI